MASLITEHWFVFYCASRAEKMVETRLKNAGYNVFLPLLETISQWSDRKKRVEKPLFPGYIFVKTSHSHLNNILQIPGIVAPVKIGKNFGFLLETEKDAICRMLISGYSIELLEQKIFPGDKVIVQDGPLKGLQGVYIGEAGNRYFIVQIETLNQAIKARVPSGSLRIL